MDVVRRRLGFLMSLVVVSAACDRSLENINAPDVDESRDLGASLLVNDCTSLEHLHEPWAPPLQDGPGSVLMSAANCAKLEDAIDFLQSDGNSFLEGVGQWADYFYSTEKFSQWGFLGSHNHPIPEPVGAGATDIIVIHYEDLDGALNELIGALCHEITHSQEWGVAHDTDPSNFDLAGYCIDVANGNPPEGPPPPPPPSPPGD